MTNPPWQRLSRNDLVTIISDYYRFLTRFYIPDSALKFPPPGGWPNITQETTKDLERSPIVINLLKHLPYIDENNARQMITNIHYKCDVVDYSAYKPHQWAEDEQSGAESVQELVEEFDERRAEKSDSEDEDDEEEYLWYRDESRDKSADAEENWFDGDDPEDIKMENMIVLADGYESGGRAIILDVFKGNIYEDMLECNLNSETPVEDYFGDLKERFERLEMVPVPGEGSVEGNLYGDINGVEEVGDDDFDEGLGSSKESAAQQFRKIYRSFGWPGDGYDKEGAVAAVKAHARRRHDAMQDEETNA